MALSVSILTEFDYVWSFKLIFKRGRRLSFPFQFLFQKERSLAVFIYFYRCYNFRNRGYVHVFDTGRA